ncbi:DUF5919 domain-containing protein [Marinactinospora rubrisoli]|uniref:DUF5919 domain-containing protein n=1 Tax=Marinactinospora rubrisoli TaxID=2715399 RepID=A0ABW2KI62_9ACTN
MSEAMLWPETIRSVVKTGPDREVVAVYPYRSACPTSTWAQLISGAQQELFFGGFTNYFLWLQQSAFHATLREKAAGGCRVRFLVGNPDSGITRQREQVEDVALTVSTRIRITLEELAKLTDTSGIETRFTHPADAVNHVSLSVFRFDHDALVTPHLARSAGHDSPMMHLRRGQEQGMFDRFAEHAEELWERGSTVEPQG